MIVRYEIDYNMYASEVTVTLLSLKFIYELCDRSFFLARKLSTYTSCDNFAQAERHDYRKLCPMRIIDIACNQNLPKCDIVSPLVLNYPKKYGICANLPPLFISTMHPLSWDGRYPTFILLNAKLYETHARMRAQLASARKFEMLV